jgi:hypothetical protein
MRHSPAVMKTVLCLLLSLLSAFPLHGHALVTPFPKVLQAGVPLAGLTASDPGLLTVYKVIVPPGASRLTVITTSGSGGVRLYVRQGVQPNQNGEETDFESSYPGTRQQIAVPNPAAGAWYIGLQAEGSYSGVQLRAIMPQAKGAVLPPVFSPQPGVYPAPVTCRIATRLKNAVVRHTTDGNDPTPGSTATPATLEVTADTSFKARVYSSTGTEGPVAEATYQVRPPGDIIDLDGNTPIRHLASAKGGRHLFRITVTANQRLNIQTEGGKGKSTLSVLRGSVPPVGKPAKGSAVLYHPSRVSIPVTEAGDYYIALDAGTNYAGRSLMAYVAGNGADLMPWADSLEPYVSVEEFSPISCEVEEGLIGAGERRLLRYNTEVRNLGAQDMVMPPPEDNPFFEYHECHGHWHFKAFASSRLLDLEGNELRAGNKVSFCLLDGLRWRSDAATRGRYDCENQGIQAGWADVYDSGLPGQWIEIGDLPGGDYLLELTVNPEGILPETNYANNVITAPVTITAE